MLAELTTYIFGVDTHKDTHTIAAVDAQTTGVVACETFAATQAGYDDAVVFADQYCSANQRAWAIEGSGSYGAGLSTHLRIRGEFVLEVESPKRPRQRHGRKTDDIDAVRAARDALTSPHPATPRQRGDQQALRITMSVREATVRMRTQAINQIKALIIGAPEPLRAKLRGNESHVKLIRSCLALRTSPTSDSEYRTTTALLHQLAHRVKEFDAEIAGHDKTIAEMTSALCPALLEESGIGPFTAALIFLGWSHSGRCHSEAAFCMLSGTAPLEASSGKTQRHRLNRGGDRQLNRALHIVVRSRAKTDPRTKEYIQKQLAAGKTKRETYRLLARYLARHYYRVLERSAAGSPTPACA